jgi:hypothetical protein
MSNHQPIKRHAAIVSFSKDHHFGLLLVWKIRQGLKRTIDAERISRYVQFFFKEDLGKHFKEEEELLFCRLPTEDVLRRRAEADHRAIRQLVVAMEDDGRDTALLVQLADRLEEHIRFEERELFNHLQDRILSEDLEAIAGRFPNDNKLLEDAWEDKFWL